jgi:sensor c-di-GMP phosphodiesterase-like protein
MMNRRLIPQIGVLLFCCFFGAAVAYAIVHAVQLTEGRAQLLDYATRLIRGGDQLEVEDLEAIAAITHDNLPFCSDQELDFMRAFVFRSPHIRDMGRTKDGRLYCSSGVGRLRKPTPSPTPDITSGDVKIYVGIPLIISSNTTGFVVEKSGVSIVLSPSSIDHFAEPPMYFSTLLYNRVSHKLLHTSVPVMPLSDAEVVAGKLIERNGTFYQPVCSAMSMVCRIAAEPRAAMLARRGPIAVGFVIAGAFLGGLLGLLLIQVHRGQRSMERQLRRAVQRGTLTVVYQPIVDLETKAIVGAEALARWINEDGEAVRPDVFIALAEERGFVSEITCLVARRVAEEVGDLLRVGNFRVTINIAAQDLSDANFLESMESALRECGVPVSAIGLELTERFAADHQLAVDVLAVLKSKGYTVYIDDFGTGYSSLAYLHELDVDAIKIDRAFTQTIGTGAVTASVVPLILEMAAKLDLQVVVEGIETEEQAEYFRGAGRGILGQGWLFGRAVPAGQLRRMVEDR